MSKDGAVSIDEQAMVGRLTDFQSAGSTARLGAPCENQPVQPQIVIVARDIV